MGTEQRATQDSQAISPLVADFLIGVDGGGSGTRVSLARATHSGEVGAVMARAHAGPSGLALGIDAAWASIDSACRQAFVAAGETLDWSRCRMACGLAGANHAPWRDAFRAAAPALAGLTLEGDAYTTLLGAHDGAAGVVIALGTGSVGIALDTSGGIRSVGGFGFPSGDEASGAWLGLRAITHAQRAVDGRGPRDALATALLQAVETVDATNAAGRVSQGHAQARDSLLHWLVNANQTAYASLAPTVVAHAGHPLVEALLAQAARDIGAMVDALDPDARYPLALCGSLAPVFRPRLAPRYAGRAVLPAGDAVDGALLLAARALRAEGGD